MEKSEAGGNRKEVSLKKDLTNLEKNVLKIH